MKSRRQLRRELDAMTERWVRAEGQIIRHVIAREEVEGENARLLLRLETLHAASDHATYIDRAESNPLTPEARAS